MLVLATSDPVRRGVMWPLDGRSSLRMVQHMLRFNHGSAVELDILPAGADERTSSEMIQPSDNGASC